MTSFISQLHIDLRTALVTKRGRQNIDPDLVPQGLAKEYVRMEKVVLPKPLDLTMSVPEVLLKRTSHAFVSKQPPLTQQQWGTLLGTALGKIDLGWVTHRRYPSGGSLYPVETYIITPTPENSQPTIFHYNPNAHTLEKLWLLESDVDIKTLVVLDPPIDVTAVIVFTGVWRRSSAKYGDAAYMLGLLEAGHMAQNIQMVATAMNFNARPLVSFVDKIVNTVLDVDIEEEQSIYAVIL